VNTKRAYDDPCGVARALGAIGERWALLVVRELLHGPKRFADLSRGLPGMSQNVLSQRLRDLEQAGIVRRRGLGPPASIRVYELTRLGHELRPVLLSLARWGSRLPLASSGELSVDALVLALQTTFDPGAADGLSACFELRFGDDRFAAGIADGVFEIERGSADRPHAVIDTDPGTLRAVVFAGRALDDAIGSGDLRLLGDRLAAERFAACFPRPADPSSDSPDIQREEGHSMAERNPSDDTDAFGELYTRHFPQVYRFVYSRLRDQRAAEEVTAEVFGKALRSVGRHQDIGKPVAAWLHQLAVAEVSGRDKTP
jgi:DNA-binding HxlR family transcriptional regulator